MLAGLLVAACAAAGADAPPDSTSPAYFYNGRPYGSERLVSPLRLIVNGGLGILQLSNRTNRLEDVYWEEGWRNLRRNLGNPFDAICQDGWWEFISSEIIPFSIDKDNAHYWPNYLNHLIGGGMSYRMMREYFTYHGFAHPTPWAVATVAVYHLVNETVEMNDRTDWRVDPIADIYLFDLGGVFLFSSDRVSRFFGETLNMSDWSFMPFYDPVTGRLENVGQNYMVRFGLGRKRRWSLMYHWCNGGEAGFSYHLGGGRNVSLAGGLEAENLIKVDRHKDSVTLVRTAGFFYDREGSLMLGVLYTHSKDARWQINLYPGLIRVAGLEPGLSFIQMQDKSVRIGLTLGSLPVIPSGLGGRVGE